MGPLCRREGALSFNCNVRLLGGTPALAFPKIDLLVVTDVLSVYHLFPPSVPRIVFASTDFFVSSRWYCIPVVLVCVRIVGVF